MNKRKLANLTTTKLDIRHFVRNYADHLSARDFNSLINQITYLEEYGAIQLGKSSLHYLNEVFSKAVHAMSPGVLYSRVFVFDQRKFIIELFDFNGTYVYRSQFFYPDKEMKVMLRTFSSQDTAEHFLVDKLSNGHILGEIHPGNAVTEAL